MKGEGAADLITLHCKLTVWSIFEGVRNLCDAHSTLREARQIFNLFCNEADQFGLPRALAEVSHSVIFQSEYNRIFLFIPVKQAETVSALKGIEGINACLLAGLKTGNLERKIVMNLGKETNFLFQTYISMIGGLGELGKGVRERLRGMGSISDEEFWT